MTKMLFCETMDGTRIVCTSIPLPPTIGRMSYILERYLKTILPSTAKKWKPIPPRVVHCPWDAGLLRVPQDSHLFKYDLLHFMGPAFDVLLASIRMPTQKICPPHAC